MSNKLKECGGLDYYLPKYYGGASRANGECICPKCKKKYYEHRMCGIILDWEGNPFLHVLCNGERVKL